MRRVAPRRPRVLFPGALALSFGVMGAGLAVGVTVFAQSANWNPAPSVTPPGDNLPGPIWNAAGLASAQDASIDVSGTLKTGAGAAFGGYNPDPLFSATMPNAYFGDGVKSTYLGETASLGLLAGDIGTDGTVYAGFFTGDGSQLTNLGCATPKFDHLTAPTFDGSIGSYAAANAACGAGTHVCTPDQLLATVRCAPVSLPASGNAWVANGPPGFTSPAANDCGGWSSNSASAYGTFWIFDGASGGFGVATSCSLSLPFACCS